MPVWITDGWRWAIATLAYAMPALYRQLRRQVRRARAGLGRLRNADWGVAFLALAFLLVLPYRLLPTLDFMSVGRQLVQIFAFESDPPAARFLDAIRDRPPLLRAFLQAFPKGGNLHVHLSGAIYVERLLEMAKTGPGLDKLCVAGDPPRVVDCDVCGTSCDAVTLADLVSGKPEIKATLPPQLRGAFRVQRLIDALSMRNFDASRGSSADQFFATFRALGPLSWATPAMLRELADASNAQGLRYIEVMVSLQDYAVDTAQKPSFDKAVAGRLEERKQTPAADWAAGEAKIRSEMADVENAIIDIVRQRAEETARLLDQQKLGGCADPGCPVDVRFVQQVNREQPPIAFFTQLLFARELLRAQGPTAVRRVVGVNIVAPEHGPDARAGARAQMALIRSLCDPDDSPCHGRLSLHAGELVTGLAPPADTRFHIAAAVDAGARRIGHGVAIGHEASPPQGKPFELLDRMARQRVAVEINLSSNRLILGVAGRDHPLRDYLAFGVPVVLSTDDEGISRSDVTNEWMQAVLDQGLTYRDLVRIARDSLEYSFLDGDSLWQLPTPGGRWREHRRAVACRRDRPGTDASALSPGCRTLLGRSEKAHHQWAFEGQLAAFEAQGWRARLRQLDRASSSR
jgi:adenosine deaminase